MLSITHVFTIILIAITIIFLYISSSTHESFSNICQTYFINLDENIDRWNKYKHKGWIRFPAINGKQLNIKELVNNGTITSTKRLKAGQIGCALSHINVLQKIKQQKEPFGLILEDDVIVPNGFSIDKLQLPKNFDIIFLGGCNIKGNRIGNLIKPTKKDGAYNLCWHAVLVNKKSVDKILNILTPLYRPIDSQFREHFEKFNVYFHYPNIINQNKTLRSTRRDIDGLPQSNYWQKHHLDVEID